MVLYHMSQQRDNNDELVLARHRRFKVLLLNRVALKQSAPKEECSLRKRVTNRSPYVV